jgi:hypothetical protein
MAADKQFGFHDVVRDPQVAARLPHSGGWRIWVHWFSVRDAWRSVKRRDWWGVRYFLSLTTMRCANFKSYRWLVFHVERPMPWLLGPAKQIHPEAFTTEPQ